MLRTLRRCRKPSAQHAHRAASGGDCVANPSTRLKSSTIPSPPLCVDVVSRLQLRPMVLGRAWSPRTAERSPSKKPSAPVPEPAPRPIPLVLLFLLLLFLILFLLLPPPPPPPPSSSLLLLLLLSLTLYSCPGRRRSVRRHLQDTQRLAGRSHVADARGARLSAGVPGQQSLRARHGGKHQRQQHWPACVARQHCRPGSR